MRRLQALRDAAAASAAAPAADTPLTAAIAGRIVWHASVEDAATLATQAGPALTIVTDAAGRPKYKRTVIVVVTDGTDYLRVLGNTWGKPPVPAGARIVRNHPNPANPINTDPPKIDSKGRQNYMIPNMNGFVKGSIEDGETDVAAAKRELVEETGLVLPEASFVFKKCFTQKKDPRTNPVYKVTVTAEQRQAITTELTRRNTENVGEIFDHAWVPLASFSVNLNENSATVYDELNRDPAMRAGGKTRRRRKSKKTKRRTRK